jgi:hypothetical protein
LGFRIWDFGFRISDFGFRISDFGFRISDFGFSQKGRLAEEFYDGVFVEVEGGDFAVVEFEDEAVEPEFVVFGVGVPGAGGFLAVIEDGTGGGGDPGVIAGGDLLGDLDALADGEGELS